MGHLELFNNTLKTQGIETRFVDPADPRLPQATDKKTRAYYAETLPNPKLQVPDQGGCRYRPLTRVPLSWTTTACPVLCKPFEHGAAIIVYSTTKYIGATAHRSAACGDGGNFDWEKHADAFAGSTRSPIDQLRQPARCGPAVKRSPPSPTSSRRASPSSATIGYAMSRSTPFQFIQDGDAATAYARHCRNTQSVVDHLKKHPAVTRVITRASRRRVRAARQSLI